MWTSQLRLFFHTHNLFLFTSDTRLHQTLPLDPLVGAQGYQRLPLSKPLVGQNIALHAASAYKAFYQHSFCLPD